MANTASQTPPDDFENAAIIKADVSADPRDADGIRITREEFELCAPHPLDLMVFLEWRAAGTDGRAPTADSLWSTLTARGARIDGSPLLLREVQDSVERLAANQLIQSTGGAQ